MAAASGTSPLAIASFAWLIFPWISSGFASQKSAVFRPSSLASAMRREC